MLANAEAGQLALDIAPLNLVELSQRRVDSFQAQAAQKGITLSFHAFEAEICLQADAQRLGQVLNNLLDNALRHTPANGSVQVEITKPQESIHLIIRDSGEGIRAEDLPYIFDRFYRGDPRYPTGSSGLGLTIVRQLVNSLGGMIWIETPPATYLQGSAFHIQFPAILMH